MSAAKFWRGWSNTGENSHFFMPVGATSKYLWFKNTLLQLAHSFHPRVFRFRFIQDYRIRPHDFSKSAKSSPLNQQDRPRQRPTPPRLPNRPKYLPSPSHR